MDSVLLPFTTSGVPFCQVDVLVVGLQGPTQLFTMRLAALKTMAWSSDSKGNGTSTYTFEYGGFSLVTQAYRPDGTPYKPVAKGWNRVNSTALTPTGDDLALAKLMP